MPRYSILGLMLFTLGIAGGLTAALAVTPVEDQLFRLEGNLGFGLRVALSALETSIIIWVCAGIAFQAWDLFKFQRWQTNLSVPQRSSLRFDLLWRCGAILIIPVTYGLAGVGKAIARTTEDTDMLAILFQDQYFIKVRWLILLVAIGVAGGYREQIVKPLPKWIGALRTLIWPVGLALILLVALNETMVQMLVYVAINGVEAATPMKWQRGPVGFELVKWEKLFTGLASVQLFFLLSAMVCTAQSAFRYGPLKTQRRTSIVLSSAFLLIVGGCEWSLRAIGLPKICPDFAEIWNMPMPLATAMLLAVIVVYLAARAAVNREHFTDVSWRAHPDAYLHERRIVLILIGVNSLVFLGHIIETFVSVQNVFGFLTGNSFLSLCQGVLSYSETYWALATILLVLKRFRATSRSRSVKYITPDFSWRRFLGFGALFALIAVMIEQSARGLCLALWLPWGWY